MSLSNIYSHSSFKTVSRVVKMLEYTVIWTAHRIPILNFSEICEQCVKQSRCSVDKGQLNQRDGSMN